MKYQRYIDNRVIQACIRPQLPKWCGPTTISELMYIFFKKQLCPHEVIKIMGLNEDTIIKGMGTSQVVKGIKLASNNLLQVQIYTINLFKPDELWKTIKSAILKKDVLYLHEKGHHVLIAGFFEEPVITGDLFLQGINCQHSLPSGLSLKLPHKAGPSTSGPSMISRNLILAEHNIKEPEKGIGSLLRERKFEEVYNELLENSQRLHLVRIYK